jgi:hypothetical protein
VPTNIDRQVNKDNENTTNEKQKEISDRKIWDAIVNNYEIIQGAQISNSFILLMVLQEANEPLTTTRISELISKRTKGHIYKISATVRDSLEYRLKREGYVKSVDIKGKSLYSITVKGRKLLEGWIAFLSAYL